MAVGLYLAFRFLREPENRGKLVAEMEKRRALRPLLALGRRLRPQFAFLGRRLTPGGLGLELTSLLAALSVGLFVLIAYWSVVSAIPGRRLATRRPQRRAGPAGELARARRQGVTDLGSGWVV